MQTDEYERKEEPDRIKTARVEWDGDFDDLWLKMKSIRVADREIKLGKEGRFRLKGRCRRCWGGLSGMGAADHVPGTIRCRVCGILLKGDDARDEYQRMSEQSASNVFNMVFGIRPVYRDDAIFVQKVFPSIERQSLAKLRQRINDEDLRSTKDGWLTRSKFPAGAVGFLFFQARALISGVERLPRELTVAPFPDSEMHDEGSTTVNTSQEELSKHSRTLERELIERLGSTMTIAMMSAFACELAMKAIRLTRMDEARKSHDLWLLYRDLPVDSRTRIKEDFPEMDSVLKSARHTFDKWRYFEANVGGRGIKAMIDTDRALGLAKAARVLKDEAELMGLGYSVKVDATQTVTKTDDRRRVHIKHRLSMSGTEAPPR